MANVLHVKGHGGASYIETDMEKKLADRKKAKQLYLDIVPHRKERWAVLWGCRVCSGVAVAGI